MSFTPSPPHLRLAAGIGVIASVTLVLAGCGRADTESASPAGAVDDAPATGTVTLWAPDGDASVLTDVVAPFEAANPDVDLEITLIPSSRLQHQTPVRARVGHRP